MSLMTTNQAIRQIYQNNIFKANALKPLKVGRVEIKIMEPTSRKGTHLYKKVQNALIITICKSSENIILLIQ